MKRSKIARRIKLSLKAHFYYPIILANDWLNNHGDDRKVIWLVGDARSGTTWVSDLINYRNNYRFVFEPFHPKAEKNNVEAPLIRYIRPKMEDHSFYQKANKIFSGKYRHPNTDQHNRGYIFSGLLVKDINANLFLKWVDMRFPQVRKILVMRHPCAVALSKEKLKDWIWMDPEMFLNQGELYEDFLDPYREVINSATSFFERQIVVWAINHYVPLKQLNRDRIYLAFYEDLCVEPETWIRHLLSYVEDQEIEGELESRLVSQIRMPSNTVHSHSAIVNNEDLISGWRKELTDMQIDTAMEILACFGLEEIYGRGLMPDRQAALEMFNQTE